MPVNLYINPRHCSVNSTFISSERFCFADTDIIFICVSDGILSCMKMCVVYIHRQIDIEPILRWHLLRFVRSKKGARDEIWMKNDVKAESESKKIIKNI